MSNSPKDDAIKASIIEQCSHLLDSNYDRIIKAAHETFKEDDDAGEIEAKVSFAVAFFPAIQSPKVEVKVSWSVRYAEEAEQVIDGDQLPLEGDVGKIARGFVSKMQDMSRKYGGDVTISTPGGPSVTIDKDGVRAT